MVESKNSFSYGVFSSRLIVLTACLAVAASAIGQAQSSFPFVIPGDDSSPSATDRSLLLDHEAGAKGFVERRGAHFFVGDNRIRFWGFNLCFGANFPTHEEADRLAPHLAKLGCNAVRFHHMDMQAAPNGIWDRSIVDGQRVFSKEMVDRLDYFLAQLHKHGIYADINLHVSRTLTAEEGYPQLDGAPWWANSNKWVMYYDKDVQRELKEYCRDLLTHRNPYRENQMRVDDPGIALVEMVNENYFSEQGYELYKRLPQRFQDSFIAAWNQWLTKRYGAQAALLASWNAEQSGLGPELFPSATFESDFGNWEVSLSQNELRRSIGVAGPETGSPDENRWKAIRLEPLQVLEQDHFQQIRTYGLTLRAQEPITLRYWVRADSEREYRAELSTSQGGEWRSLGLFETLIATPEWQQVKRVILPNESIEQEAALVFTIGSSTTPIEFAGIQLQSGSEPVSLPATQNLADMSIQIPDGNFPAAAHQDMRLFMIETERAWLTELKTYLIDELGVKVPITGSQLNYHPSEIVEEVYDFADLHNYWHHPIFPSGQDWSADQWTIQNEPMEAYPTRSKWPASSLLMRTGWRFNGMPMTLSEWNYPEPSFYSGGCVPMAAVLAGLQDWDGVFFFDYDAFSRNGGESSNFFREQTVNYFSFNGAPVKLALFSQFANVFLRNDLEPLQDKIDASFDAPADGRLALTHRIGMSLDGNSDKRAAPDFSPSIAAGDQLRWTAEHDLGWLELNTPRTIGTWGTIANRQVNSDMGWTISVGDIEPNYGFVILSSNDATTISTATSLLLTVVSHSQNQNMGWNADQTSVGREWGAGPTLVTSFEAEITFPVDSVKQAKVYALDGIGKRITEVPAELSGGSELSGSPAFSSGTLRFVASPKYETLWYEIEIDR